MRRSYRPHRRGTEQIAQAGQVVGDHVQTKHRTDVLSSTQFELVQSAPLLDPAKHLLDATSVVIDQLAQFMGVRAAEIFLSHSSSIWSLPICWNSSCPTTICLMQSANQTDCRRTLTASARELVTDFESAIVLGESGKGGGQNGSSWLRLFGDD